MDSKKYTIKDVAELAGVSKGTVDRVLHERGKVSQKAFEKVNRVLKELDFKPNPIARSLKNNKVYKIAVLLPDSNIDSYWIPARKGIKSAAKEYKAFGILVEEFLYHPFEKKSFIEKSQEALSSNADAILMAPLFREESIKIYNLCKEKNLLLALFNNYTDSIEGKFYIGQDLVQCGRIGASLVDKMVKKKNKIAVVHIDKEPHMQLKENGFKNYFNENLKNAHKVITHNFSTRTELDFSKDISSFLNSNKDLKAIFITNSKSYLLVNELEKLQFDCIIIGFDLLDENIKYLEAGSIDFLIHQKPKRQAYLSVESLAEYFLFGKKISTEKLLPIDIITSENVKYYIN